MNEVEMKNEPLEERFEFFSNPQTKSNRTSQIERQKTKKKSLTNYMLKEKYWNPIIKIIYMGSFYYVNDNAKVDNKYL